jgi:C-terminal processing protease CtpA/Prc
VLVGGAAEESKQISPGDAIVAVDGVSAAHLSLEEVEKLLSGPVFAPVSIRVRGGAKGESVVDVIRRCSAADDDSAVESLETFVQTETISTASRLHEDLERFRHSGQVHAQQLATESAAWREEKAKLQQEVSMFAARAQAAEEQAQKLEANSALVQTKYKEECDALALRAKDARETMRQSQAELENAMSAVSSLKSELSAMQSAYEQANADRARALQVAEDASKGVETAENAATQADSCARAAAGRLQEMQAKVLALENSFAAANARSTQLAADKGISDRQQDDLVREVDTLKNKVSETVAELQTSQSEAQGLKSEMEQLKRKIASEQERAKGLEAEIAAGDAVVEKKRLEMRKALEIQVGLEESRKSAQEQEQAHRKRLQEATAEWDKARVSYQQNHDAMQARMTLAAKTAQAMYAAICLPCAGSVTGLGLELVQAGDDGRNPVVQQLLANGPAFRSGKVHVGDVLLAVDGTATQSSPMEHVETMLCGVIGKSVTLRLQTQDAKKAYDVVLTRELATDEKTIDTLVASLSAEATKRVAGMHEELLKLRERVSAESVDRKQQERVFREERDALQAELAAARNKLEAVDKEVKSLTEHRQQLDVQHKKDVQALQNKLQEAKKAKDKAVEQMDELNQAKIELKKRLIGFSSAAEDAERTVLSNSKRLSDAASALAAAEDEVKALKDKIEKLEAKTEAGNVRIMTVESEKAAAEKAQLEAAEMSEKKDAKIEELTRELADLRRLMDRQAQELEVAQERSLRQREEKNEQAKKAEIEAKRVAAREADLEAAETSLSMSKQQTRELQDKISALEQDLSKAIKEHQHAQKELEEARKAGQSWSARCQGHEADSKMLLTAVQMLQLHICKPVIGGSYGVGITLAASAHGEADGNGFVIAALVPGAAAAVSGKLSVGDRVVAVNDTSLEGSMSLEQVQALFTGVYMQCCPQSTCILCARASR